MVKHIALTVRRMAGSLRSTKGSALLWVLFLAMLALLAGGGIARLLVQREAVVRADYSLFRAVCNAENGLEWARLRWLEALSNDEDLPSGTTGRWKPLGTSSDQDQADVTLTRRADGTWNVTSIGSFMNARRRLDAVLPDLGQGLPAVLAVADLLIGNGTLHLVPEMNERYFINPERVSGVIAQTLTGETSILGEMIPLQIQTPPLATVQKLQGDYREGMSTETLELATLQTTLQPLWSGAELYTTIACGGRLQLGQDPDQSLYLSEGRLVLIAEEIEITGTLSLNHEVGAELWLLATKSITWTSSTLTEHSFRGLIWSPGTVNLRGTPQASWCIDGALFAGRLYLENCHIFWREPPQFNLPMASLPRKFMLPELRHLRILAIES